MRYWSVSQPNVPLRASNTESLSGYQYNYALCGARTRDMKDVDDGGQGLVSGLDSQHDEGITHVVSVIGANDFVPYPSGTIDPHTGTNETYGAIYHNWATQAQIDAGVEENIATARWTLERAQASDTTGQGRFVLANLPDYGVAPYTWGESEYEDPGKREQVTDVIRDVNSQLDGLAREFDIPLVDIFSFSKVIFGENSDVKDPDDYTLDFFEKKVPDTLRFWL